MDTYEEYTLEQFLQMSLEYHGESNNNFYTAYYGVLSGDSRNDGSLDSHVTTKVSYEEELKSQ